MDTTANILSDNDDLYAHESQSVIKQIGGIDYLFLLYMSNKVSGAEWGHDAHALLKVFNLATKAHIRTFDLFYPGIVAGETLPNDEINVPRMYLYGANILRCVCPNTSTLYTRDIDISDSTPANWTVGNISIMQMTMKDAAGNDVVAEVTSENIQIHLDFVFGDDFAGYHNLMPLFRNGDIAKSGANWYGTLECSGERSHGLARPTLNIISSDSGNTWRFGSPVGYTISSRVQAVESSIFFIGIDLHIISRGAAILHFKSVDNGVTWTSEANLPLSVLSTKPCGINYVNAEAELRNVMAITLVSQVSGNTGRTTTGIYSTNDFATYFEIARIITPTYCHYPSLFYYAGHLYLSYTKGIPEGAETDRNAIGFVRIY